MEIYGSSVPLEIFHDKGKVTVAYPEMHNSNGNTYSEVQFNSSVGPSPYNSDSRGAKSKTQAESGNNLGR